jgi:hypothetical protein
LGNLSDLPNLHSDFQSILQSADAEYIDFINYGIRENIFPNMGFQKLDVNGKIIIPNYFEPFEQHNEELNLHIKQYSNVCFRLSVWDSLK